MAKEISVPIKWHGGKHYLAPKIIALMPTHVHYVEPYAGELSVLLAKNPDGVSEVVNDIHGGLTNFWRMLQQPDTFAEFVRMCEATPFSEAEWQNANDPPLYPNDPIHKARLFFVRCRQSLAGRMDSFAPLSRTRTRRGMNEQASAWINAVDGLAAVHARLRRVVILNRDSLDVIRQQDGPETLFYLDPPYLHETRATTGEYEHEMDKADHLALLNTIGGIEGKILLSGYRSDLYDKFAHDCGWSRHEFDLPNNSAGGKSKKRKIECVWKNY